MWVLYSYNKYSESAKALSKTLNIPFITKLVPGLSVINWGSSEYFLGQFKMLNNPSNVRKAVDKLETFSRLRSLNIPTVDFTLTSEQAREWINKGNTVYCRTKVKSSSGDGIVLASELNQMPEGCRLFTKAVVNPKEYRVHVVNNNIIDITQKKRRLEEDASQWIRNYDNGWVYTRDGIQVPRSVKVWSKLAVTKLGLDFGAVDILYKDGLCYVLEVNTAPGIEGTTLVKYAEAFKNLMKEVR